MAKLAVVLSLVLCLSTTFLHQSEASRLKGRSAYPVAEDEAEASEAADEGLSADSARAAAPPYNVESTEGVQNAYAHGLDDHHIEPESAGADDLMAPEALPQGLGAEVEKIEQVKADEEAETPGENEVTANYIPTEEDKAVVMDRVEEAPTSPAEAPPATPQVEESAAPSGSPAKGVNIVNNNCCGSFKQINRRKQKINRHQHAPGRFVQQDEDNEGVEDEAEASEEEEADREGDIDEAEEQYLEKKEEVAKANTKELKKPLSAEEAKKLLKDYAQSLENVVNSIVSTHAGVRDLLGTEARKAT